MPGMRYTINLKFPCGYELKEELKVEFFALLLGNSSFETLEKYPVCPIHGKNCKT